MKKLNKIVWFQSDKLNKDYKHWWVNLFWLKISRGYHNNGKGYSICFFNNIIIRFCTSGCLHIAYEPYKLCVSLFKKRFYFIDGV